MAKFDLITMLTLNASGFNDGINKAKKSSDDFGKGVQNISSGIKSAFSSMLGAVGLGVTVFEGVKKTIEATQLTSDKFEKSMAQGKSAVDYFFISLSSGDFTNFLSGLKDSIKAAGELADVLDNLEDVRRGLDITKSKNQSTLTDKALIYKDKTGKYSKDERQQAFGEAKDIMTKEASDSYNTFVTEAEAILNDLAAKTGLSADKIKDIIENYKGSYDTMFSEIQDKMDNLSFGINKAEYIKTMPADQQGAATIWLNFQKASAEKLNAVSAALTNQYNAENNIKNVGLDLMRTYNELFKVQEDGNKKVNEDLTTQLEKLNEINTATQTSIAYKAPAVNDQMPTDAPAPYTTLGLDSSYINTDFVQGYSDGVDTMVDKNKQLEKSFDGLAAANAIVGDSFVQMAEDGKISMAEVTAFIMQSIMKVIMGKLAETAAYITADSFKKGGWLGFGLAAAGIAGVTALFGSIQSQGGFADGGIIGGQSFSGDKLNINANSREMIMNQGQQQKLWDFIRGGSTGSGGGQVEFKIKGAELVGVMSNYGRQVNSYR